MSYKEYPIGNPYTIALSDGTLKHYCTFLKQFDNGETIEYIKEIDKHEFT